MYLFPVLQFLRSVLRSAGSTRRPLRTSLRRAVCAVSLASFLVPAFAGERAAVLLPPIRAIAYPSRAAAMPDLPCLYARDLPLIALMGANTVRTYGLLPEGDRTFLNVLDSTGLRWLAGFPVERYSAARTSAFSDAFRKYAARFRGNPRVLGYVLAGASGRDLQALVAEAAAILREIEPARGLLLSAEVRDPAAMTASMPGLAFWTWDAGSRTTAAMLSDARQKASRPVLVSISGTAQDDGEQAAGTAASIGQIEADAALAGGIYGDFSDSGAAGIFRSAATQYPGLDTLTPRPVYLTLAGVWRGTFPSAWEEQDGPRLGNPDGPTSAGALIRISGTALARASAPYADEAWPYYLAGSCLCVSGTPARLSFVSDTTVAAQIPPATEPGPRALVFYRAGRASNFTLIHVSEFSAGTFAGIVLEARLR